MRAAVRHLNWQAPQAPYRFVAAPIDSPARGWLATLAALAIFVPLWMSRPLMVGDFSLAFAVPFALAAWALFQPAPPGRFEWALQGGYGRGLWIEALAVLGILLLAFMSILYSHYPERAFRVILPMAYAICALVLLSRLPPLTRRRIIYAMVFSGVLVIALALLMSQTGWRSQVMPGYRFRAFAEVSNQLGLMILAIFPLTVALLLNARTARMRLLCAASILVLVAAILLSAAKTSLALGFVAGAWLWLYHASRRGSLDKTMITLVLVASILTLSVPLLLWVLSWASPAAYERVDQILTGGVKEYSSMQTRDAIWQESIRLGMENPLLGVGAGTKVLGWSHSHNMLADYFRGMGVLGLVGAAALVLSVIARGAAFLLRTWHKGVADRELDTVVAAMYLGAIAYLIGNQLSDSFSPTTAFLFWMLYLGAYLTSMQLTPPRRPNGQASTLGWTSRRRQPA